MLVVICEGYSFVDMVFGVKFCMVDYSFYGVVVYVCLYEVVSIGLIEEEVVECGQYDVYSVSFWFMCLFFVGLDVWVVMKLIVDSDSQKVVGCYIFGFEVGEMIQFVVIFMGMGVIKV